MGARWLLAALLAGMALADATPVLAAGTPAVVLRARASRSLDEVLAILAVHDGPLPEGERDVVRRALALTPSSRPELRERLEARLALTDTRLARKQPFRYAGMRALRPYASPFHVAALLPDEGDYADYAAVLRQAIVAGLATSSVPLDLVSYGTGDDDAPRAAAALDSAVQRCDIVVGELLSVPTRALATATRFMGVPLVSPSATDESIGRIGPAVFQVGPTRGERGVALARAMLAGAARKYAVVASQESMRGALVRGFVAEADTLGAKLVRREPYAAGTSDFRMIARSVRAAGAEVLLWDGEGREGEALVRALASEGVNVQLCGDERLAPEQFHNPARSLLDGVVFVGEDWRLPAPVHAMLDSLARARDSKPGALWIRGYLAGRRIAAVIDAGARTPGELSRGLQHRDPASRASGMLDCELDGATLPLFVVQRGRAVEWKP